MEIFFWTGVFLILWHYLLYGLTLSFWAFFKKNDETGEFSVWPGVSIIITAHNEEQVIARRINNCYELDYPPEQLEIIIGSDGSTDNTVDIAESFNKTNIKVLNFPKKRGRSQVHNDCVENSAHDIIFFTDADSLYHPDCIKKMVRHYANTSTGCVGGELRTFLSGENAIGKGLGFYWKWEYLLRNLQSRLGILTKVSGANMSIRKCLYTPLPEYIDIDQSLEPEVLLKNYKVVHEPRGIVYDSFNTTPTGEFSSRKRLTIRALTALVHYRQLFNIFKYPLISLNLISYRLLRYLMPVLLLMIFIINTLLTYSGSILYVSLFVLQIFFYFFAYIGFFMEKNKKAFFLFSWPFAFCWSSLGILAGDLEFISGKRIKEY